MIIVMTNGHIYHLFNEYYVGDTMLRVLPMLLMNPYKNPIFRCQN